MQKRLPTLILVLIFLIGLSLLLYPTVSDYWNSFHQTRAILSYEDDVSKLDEAEYDRLWAAAEDYNQALFLKGSHYTMTEEETAAYEALLNVAGHGVMGYVEIPAINCRLPIYHGTREEVLQVAAGHLEWTSLPVGGESTHCVISGHRGLPSAKLFTDLDQLEEGDFFLLRVLNERLTYEVDQILIVEPQELDALAIAEGEDLCTLVTCTPYGVNSHRLLVRGHRVADLPETSADHVSADAMQIEPIIVAPLVAAPMLLCLLGWLVFRSKKKKQGP